MNLQSPAISGVLFFNPMQVSVILNPKSGMKGRHNNSELRIRKILENQDGISFHLIRTEFAGHATELAKESSSRGDDICFAAGGDGTMNEVARGLIGSNTSLGIIPLGSGNGLARHLKIPLRIEEAIIRQLKGNIKPMDHGEINSRKFFLAAGIGFEGAVASRFSKKRFRGFISYILSAAEEYFNWKGVAYKAILHEGIVSGSAFTIDFANGSQYGNNAIISPGSEIDDGLLQFVRVLPFPILAAPNMFFQLMGGSLNKSAYHLESAFTNLELSIEGKSQIEGHVDGEPVVFSLPLSVSVKPESLFIRIPAA